MVGLIGVRISVKAGLATATTSSSGLNPTIIDNPAASSSSWTTLRMGTPQPATVPRFASPSSSAAPSFAASPLGSTLQANRASASYTSYPRRAGVTRYLIRTCVAVIVL